MLAMQISSCHPLQRLLTQQREGWILDTGDHQLNMTTQPTSLTESQSSQTDLNNLFDGGETQLVNDNRVGLDDTQLPLAGETQLVNDQEGFDDMVVVQNDTLAASPILLTNGDQSVSYETLQGGDGFDVPVFEPIDSAGMRVLNRDSAPFQTKTSTGETETSVPYQSKASTEETDTSVVLMGPNERVLVTEMPTVTKHPETQPAATRGQLFLPGFNIPEPQLALSHVNEVHDGGGEGDEQTLFKDGEAEKDVKEDVTGQAKVVGEQDIQAIKGRKVVKKFGRRNYEGEVVDYDNENQWFKVVYEDGDNEDLELVEVKEILLMEDTLSNTSTTKRKRSRLEGGASDQQASKSKKRRNDNTKTPHRKGRDSMREKGTPKKKGSSHAKKKSQRVKSPGSKAKGLKATKVSELQKRSDLEIKPDEILDASAYESPVRSLTRSGGKRKGNSGIQAATSIQLGSESAGKNKLGNAKTTRKNHAKKKLGRSPKENSSKRRETRRSKLPNAESKVVKALQVGEGEKGDDTKMPKGKRLRSDTSEDQDVFIGKAVKKDFDGILYTGVVAKFNKKSKYYKVVKYEDGDQEDLELEELKAVLVQ